jgi:outer membrane immunogenic protein
MNTAKLLAVATLISSAMASTSVLAGGDSGFYIGAGAGQASADGSSNAVQGNFDGDDTAYKLIGGYNFGIIPLVDLGVELEYVDFGKPDDNVGGLDIQVDANAVAAFGIAGLNFGPFGVFGKVGAFNWDADLDVEGSGSTGDDGNDLAYGIGARFHIASFQIRAEYEYFDLDASDLNDADLDLLSASFIYTF